MAIPSKQIGWSTQSNLLWEISKQLERLTCVLAGGCSTTTTTSTIIPTTTTTTTEALFSSKIYWGEDSGTACGEILEIDPVVGDGTTFCNSNNFTSIDFSTIGNVTIFISYGGQIKTVDVTLGSNIATFNGGCDPCV